MVLEMARQMLRTFLQKIWTYQIPDRGCLKKLTFLRLHDICGVKTRSAMEINNCKEHLMRHCVSDKHFERLKVRIINYQIGGFFPQRCMGKKLA